MIAPELPFEIRLHEIIEPEDTIEIMGYHIHAFKVNHNVLCYGYSIEIPRKGRFNVDAAKEMGIPIQLWNPLQKGQNVEFEGKKYKAPVGYDRWLRAFYGDYMQLPPVEERVRTHNFTAYWKS